MPCKKINIDELDVTIGPMNSVAKFDALSYSGLPDNTDLDLLDPHHSREVRAKKKKMVRSTVKQDRSLARNITKLY